MELGGGGETSAAGIIPNLERRSLEADSSKRGKGGASVNGNKSDSTRSRSYGLF